jgi:CHAD domain-containing protein
MSPKKKRAEPLRDPRAPECRILRSNPIDDELRRIARAEIDFALAHTRSADRKPVRAVHQCRKAIKRLRALVRLGSNGDEGAAREIDRALRDAARLLAEARDAEVVHRTAAGLGAGDAGRANPIRLEPRAAAAAPGADVMQQVGQRLADAAAGVDACFASARTRESLSASVEQTCCRVVRRMEAFRDRNGQGRAHDWRKSVQRYANQLRIVADLWPERADAELGPLDELAKCLGKYNDLTILRAALDDGRVGADAESRSILDELARTRQRVLRERALDLGESLSCAHGTAPTAMRVERAKDPHHWL